MVQAAPHRYILIFLVFASVQSLDFLISYEGFEYTEWWSLQFFAPFTFDIVALCLVHVIATWQGEAEDFVILLIKLQYLSLLVHATVGIMVYMIRYPTGFPDQLIEWFITALEFEYEGVGFYRAALIGILIAKILVFTRGATNGTLRRSARTLPVFNDFHGGIIDLRRQGSQASKEN